MKRVIEGILDLVGKVGEGSMTVKYTSFPPYDTSYKILDTDYDTYAVMWSCNGIGPVHTREYLLVQTTTCGLAAPNVNNLTYCLPTRLETLLVIVISEELYIYSGVNH